MITKVEAISFLKKHQPMPNDEDLEKKEIEEYERVRKFFLKNPDEQCIPLFLNSFGGKSGFGVYQMVEDVILMYDAKKVIPYLLEGFNSLYDSVRYWNVQIAANFIDSSLFVPLVNLLQSKDVDIKFATITALAQLALNNMKSDEIINIIKNEYEKTCDEDIREFCEEVLLDIQDSNR